MLEAQLRHRYGNFTLDAECTITHPWTVVFGPSGSGKSTILRMLAGLAIPHTGRIVFENRVLLDTARRLSIAPGQRGLGYVSQKPSLFPHLSVAHNVSFGLRALPASERRKRVEEMLALVDASELRELRPSQLSGGQSQRVALARALAPKPRLLLLDEPLAGLEARAKEPILRRLRECGVPVIYVSHDLTEIWPLNAQALRLEDGAIREQGKLQDVLADDREHLLAQLRITAE